MPKKITTENAHDRVLSLKFDVYDPDLEQLLQNLIKAHGLKPTYTAAEFRREVVPMGRTKFWQEQRAGRLQISRLGRNVRVSGRQAALYLLVARARGRAPGHLRQRPGGLGHGNRPDYGGDRRGGRTAQGWQVRGEGCQGDHLGPVGWRPEL